VLERRDVFGDADAAVVPVLGDVDRPMGSDSDDPVFTAV
jgi:hypothetical protein